MRSVVLLAALIATSACSSEGSNQVSTSAEPSKEPSKAAPEPAAKSAAGLAGSHLEFALSSGQTLSVVPTKCTADASGTGSVEADEGKFVLGFTAGAGKLKWTHADGTLEVDTAVMVTGKSLTFSGLTPEGAGFNGEVTCP